MKNLLLILTFVISSTACANKDSYCLIDEKGKSILIISTDYPNISFLKYYPYLEKIKIVDSQKVSYTDMGDDAPKEVYRNFYEKIGTKKTGLYTFMSQGYILYSATYTNFKTKKTTEFEIKNRAELEGVNCI